MDLVIENPSDLERFEKQIMLEEEKVMDSSGSKRRQMREAPELEGTSIRAS